MQGKDLIGKTLANIDVDGFGVEMLFTDGIMFIYDSSDGGYSNWTISRDTLGRRLNRGWTVDDALSTPLGKKALT